MSHASVAASVRGSREMFDEVLRVQSQLEADFGSHDDRQRRFKRQFARETRRHLSAISGLACVADAAPSSNLQLYARTSKAYTRAKEIDQPMDSARRKSRVLRQLQQLTGPSAEKLHNKPKCSHHNKPKCSHLPPAATTGVVCDTCGSFKRAELIAPLLEHWDEFIYEDTGKRYYYHHQTKQVLWSPPPGTSPFAVLVFEHTNSVSSVCHCIPSH